MNVDTDHADFDIDACSNTAAFGFDDSEVAKASGPSATNLHQAVTQNIPRKIALIVVRGIADDGTVDVIVSAWNVPR